MPLEKSSQGAELKAWLLKNGLSQKSLAEAMGVSEGAVSFWIKGGAPEWHQRAKLERFTSGSLRASGWLTSRESEEIERVVPFRGARSARRKAN